ncbi:MAG: hypothetical protein R6W76_02940 [Caldilinea sp.]
MNQGRSPQNIEDAWRETLDLSLETGESPVFCVDAISGGLAGMNAVLALALLDAQRNDLTTPSLVIGGVSPLWLATLWHIRPETAPQRTQPTTIVYSAPDVATHLVARTTSDTRRSIFYRRPGNLPPWAQPEAGPESNPAAPDRWEVAPLSRFSMAGGRDGWLAWAGVVTAIALLLIAVLS